MAISRSAIERACIESSGLLLPNRTPAAPGLAHFLVFSFRSAPRVDFRPPDYANLYELPVRAVDSLLERLVVLPSRPAKRERDWASFGTGFLEPVSNSLGIGKISIEESDE